MKYVGGGVDSEDGGRRRWRAGNPTCLLRGSGYLGSVHGPTLLLRTTNNAESRVFCFFGFGCAGALKDRKYTTAAAQSTGFKNAGYRVQKAEASI